MDNLNTKSPFIKNPFITKILDLFDLLRRKKRHFNVASCLLLVGESGSGKSEIAKYYVKKNPVQEQKTRTHIPVLHFELKAISTPRELLRSLLIKIGDPQQGMGARNKGELHDRLVILIKLTGVELLILDEIQVIIERRSHSVITGIADLFKDLIKDTEIPIVFMGMPWSKYLIDSNKQLKNRISYRYTIPPYRITKIEDRNDYRKLLKMLSDAYKLSGKISLEKDEIPYRFFSVTEGNLSLTVRLISDAYILSSLEKKDINIELFAFVMSTYGVSDEDNPFLMKFNKLVFKELTIHSDWNFGAKASKNSIIKAEYVEYGITENKRFYTIDDYSE